MGERVEDAGRKRISTRRVQLPLHHRLKDLLPSVLLAGDRLAGIQAFLQAQPRLRLIQTQDPGAVAQFEQENFYAAFHWGNLASKSTLCQHFVQGFRSSDSPPGVRRSCRILKISFIKLCYFVTSLFITPVSSS